MISRRRLSQIRKNLRDRVDLAANFSTKTLLTTLDPLLSADKIYNKFYGSHAPITYNFSQSLSPKMEDTFLRLKITIDDYRVNPPTPSSYSAWRIALPISLNKAISLYSKNKAQVVPLIDYESSYASTTGIEIRSRTSTEEEVEFVHPYLLDAIGQENFDGLNRLDNLLCKLHAIPSSLAVYAEQVRSVGGLYHQLPVLNSLLSASDVEHVTLVRLTPPPPIDLVNDLNLLASLLAARGIVNAVK